MTKNIDLSRFENSIRGIQETCAEKGYPVIHFPNQDTLIWVLVVRTSFDNLESQDISERVLSFDRKLNKYVK